MPYFKLGMDKKVIVPYHDYLKAMKPDFRYVGSKEQIEDLVRCLFLPSANSVKVVAPRGVGSTSLLDGLVHHQQDDFIPDEMMIRPIFRLNGNSLFNTADNKIIESRFQEALEELRKYAQLRKVKPILTIDENGNFVRNAPRHVINALVEAAVVADYVDVVITVDAKKEADFNSKHPEFASSFTSKYLEEPKTEAILPILRFHADKHAKDGVVILDDTLEHVIEITDRFKGLYDTSQPNRAIRLLDSSATAFRMEIHSRPPGTRERQARLDELTVRRDCAQGDEAAGLQAQIEALQEETAKARRAWEDHRAVIKQKQDAIREFDNLITENEREIQKLDAETRSNNFGLIRKTLEGLGTDDEVFKGMPKGEVLKLGEDDLLRFVEFDIHTERNPAVRKHVAAIDDLSQRVSKLQADLSALSRQMHVEEEMPSAFVDAIASAQTKTPVGGIGGRLRENLKNGVALMKQTVFGQDHVIEPIIRSLQRTAAGLNDPNRPLGVFMIPGPPGNGKTYITEQLAVQLFGSMDFYYRIDMENYKAEHTVSALIGAPPGYAGHGKKGLLIDVVQKMPFGVLALDEISEAHYEVRQALLKAMSSGEMVGLDGEKADFRNAIIVSTTNYGQEVWIDNDAQTASRLILERMYRDTTVFSPQYLDRHDAIMCTGPLDDVALERIAKKQIGVLRTASQRRHPDLDVQVPDEDVRAFVEHQASGKSGRAVKRMIDQVVGDKLTEVILGDDRAGGAISGRYVPAAGALTFEHDGRKGAAAGPGPGRVQAAAAAQKAG